MVGELRGCTACRVCSLQLLGCLPSGVSPFPRCPSHVAAGHAHGFVWIHIFSSLGYMPRSGNAGSEGNLSTFCRTADVFSEVAAPSDVPPAWSEGSHFSTSRPTLVTACLLYDSRFSGCEMKQQLFKGSFLGQDFCPILYNGR